MKFNTTLILLISLVLISAASIFAQDSPSAAEMADKLRTQLRDVQTEEAELQARMQQLEWDLKPENIEHYYAGTGSTRPEELREQRRRQLQGEKDRGLARLDQLAASRARLESAIITADGEAYRQSAQAQLNQMLGPPSLTTIRLMIGVLVLLAVAGGIALVVVIRRRRRFGRMPLRSL